MLFYRDFRGFQGGHLKVWHYFNHTRHSAKFEPKIHFSAESIWNNTNPWHNDQTGVVRRWDSAAAEALFLAGLDWQQLSPEECTRPRRPIINLIQGFRHIRPDDPCYKFLEHRAVRICVSPELTHAVETTGRANGPIFTIPNGIDLLNGPSQGSTATSKTDVLIAALKNPRLGRSLFNQLASSRYRIELFTAPLPRSEYLQHVANSEISLFLPAKEEGFYLPALEAMGLGSLVICPDCIGNRSFCIDGENSLMPDYTETALLATVISTLSLDIEQRTKLINAEHSTAQRYCLSEERNRFLDILNNIDQIW